MERFLVAWSCKLCFRGGKEVVLLGGRGSGYGHLCKQARGPGVETYLRNPACGPAHLLSPHLCRGSK